jgi:hypothetical protein
MSSACDPVHRQLDPARELQVQATQSKFPTTKFQFPNVEVTLGIWDLDLGIWDFSEVARPAGLEPATSWFVATTVRSKTRESIERIATCHARLPREL